MNMQFDIDTRIDVSEAVAVYSLHTAYPLWLGIVRVDRLMRLDDARRHPHVRLAIEATERIGIAVHLVTRSMQEARERLLELRREMPSACISQDGPAPRLRGRKVQRQDGVIYASASEAARANNICRPNLSVHLARRPGYNTVGGWIFHWVD